MTGLYPELGQRHSFLLGLAVAEGQALAGPKGEGQHLIRKWHKFGPRKDPSDRSRRNADGW